MVSRYRAREPETAKRKTILNTNYARQRIAIAIDTISPLLKGQNKPSLALEI